MRQNNPLSGQSVERWLPFPFVAEHSRLPDISPNQPENYETDVVGVSGLRPFSRGLEDHADMVRGGPNWALS
jgi:hypothetical protein